jgi:DNA helicase-2/ATP-dependent DNA helicase PcrA
MQPPTQRANPSNSGGEPLNNAQKTAAEAANGPLLIVAGAGTGKTKTLTTRIIHLIKGGIPAERICAITFTNKAAKEMARRVGRTGPFLGTFHALGARILRKECRKAGRDPNFAIFDAHDSFDLIKKAVKEIIPPQKKNEDDAFPMPKNAQAKQETPAYFAQKISEIKNLGLDALTAKDPALVKFPEKKARVLRVFEKYEELLARNNAFDFDDLIEKPVKIFKEHPDVFTKYQNMFDAVLVDEYQDINPKQYELVALLAGAHHNLSVVGDDEQTIYSWRYADINTFLNFDKEWKGAKVHFLEQNYRSTGTIIRAAAEVVQHNRFRTPKTLWTENPDGDPITLFEAWGENDEAEWIAEEIRKLRMKDKNADIGILYRTNAQSRPIEQALIRYNIPYKIFGGLKFYERKEVKDAIAALRYIANRRDEVAKERLEKNLTKRRFAEFARAIPVGAEAPTPLAALKIFLDSFRYFDFLEANFTNADEREENVTELIAFASEFTDLDELLERLGLLEAADEVGKENDASRGKEVNLMTIHLAKGLEFDTVFLAGVAEGFLPHGRSIDSEASLEEERRLMYVAMTRARKKLHLSFYGIPSRFVAEIPEDCVKFVTEGKGEDSADKGEYNEPSWEENVVDFE